MATRQGPAKDEPRPLASGVGGQRRKRKSPPGWCRGTGPEATTVAPGMVRPGHSPQTPPQRGRPPWPGPALSVEGKPWKAGRRDIQEAPRVSPWRNRADSRPRGAPVELQCPGSFQRTARLHPCSADPPACGHRGWSTLLGTEGHSLIGGPWGHISARQSWAESSTDPCGGDTDLLHLRAPHLSEGRPPDLPGATSVEGICPLNGACSGAGRWTASSTHSPGAARLPLSGHSRRKGVYFAFSSLQKSPRCRREQGG